MKTLHRSRRTRLLGGVAAGLAEYFAVDVTLMRLGFAMVAILIPNAVLAYILAWIIIPEEPLDPTSSAGAHGENPSVKVSDSPVESGNTGSVPPTAEELLGDRPATTAPQPASPQPVARPAVPSNQAPAQDARGERGRQLLGYILVFVGAAILLRRFVPDSLWRLPSVLLNQFWPVLIVILGVALVLGAIKGR